MYQDFWKRYEANELTHSAAHHLMAVHELKTHHGYARVSDVAKYLKITKGSVSSAMKHLKERGYLREAPNRFLELTDSGMRVVWETESTRLVVQKFLNDALGMDEDDAEIEAAEEAFAEASERNGLSVIVSKVEAVGPASFAMDIGLLENRFEFARHLAGLDGG